LDSFEEIFEISDAESSSFLYLHDVEHPLDDRAGYRIFGMGDDLVGVASLLPGEFHQFRDARLLGHLQPTIPLLPHHLFIGDLVQGSQLLEHEHHGVDVLVHPQELLQLQLALQLLLALGLGGIGEAGGEEAVLGLLEQLVALVVARLLVGAGDPQAHLVHHILGVIGGHVKPVAHNRHMGQLLLELAGVGVVLVHGHALDALIQLLAVDGEERIDVLLGPPLADKEHLPGIEGDDHGGVLVALEDGELVHGDALHPLGLGYPGVHHIQEVAMHPPDQILGDGQPPGGGADGRAGFIHLVTDPLGEVDRHMPVRELEWDRLGEGVFAVGAPSPAVCHMPEGPSIGSNGHRLQWPS